MVVRRKADPDGSKSPKMKAVDRDDHKQHGKRENGSAMEVWVHPNLNRMVKGSDYKFASGEAEQYWMDRRAKKPQS